MAKGRIVYVVDDKELKELSKELKGIQGENKKVEEGFKGTNDEIKKSKTSVVDLKGAIAGLGLAALAGAAIKEFIQLNAEIAKSRKEVALLTKTTGLALDNITAKIRATSKVFDKDFNEILRTANTVSKEFGVSMTAALDEINQGFTRGLDINGEYLDTLREYSTFIKDAGLNTTQFNLLIQKQVTQGIFSDKGIDALKEGVITLNDMTPAARDAINAVGLSSDKLLKDISTGTITAFEAIQQITKATTELNDVAKKGSILAEIFRGAGEDAGNYIFTLDELGTEFEELTDEQQSYVDAQDALLKATEETQRELLNLTSSTQSLGIAIATFWENIKSGTIGGLDLLIKSFQSAETQIENFRQGIAGADKESLQGALKELNEELVIAEKELKLQEEQQGKNSLITKIWENNINELNIKITEAENRVKELEQAEIDEAEAAIQAEIATKELAAAKKLQVEATEKARKESIAAAKAMEKEAEATRKATEASRENLELKSKPAFDVKSDFLQEVEDKAALNEILIEQEKKLKDDLFEINKEHNDRITEAEEDAADLKAEREQFAVDTAIELARSFIDLQSAELERQFQVNEVLRANELAAVAGNKDAEDAINRKFNAKQDALREQQKQKEKAQAVISILINSATAALKGISLFGPPPSPLGIAALAAVGIITALQLGAVAKLKDGVIDLQGPGTSTSDSIPTMLSKHESVMTAQETNDFLPTLTAIRNREISPDILNNIAMYQDTQPRTIVYDYEKLAKAVMNQPQKSLVADENGLTGYFLRQGKSLEIKQAKYKM